MFSDKNSRLYKFLILFISVLMCLGLFLKFTFWNERLMLFVHSNQMLPEKFWMALTVSGSAWVGFLLVSILDRKYRVYSLAAIYSLIIGGLIVTFLKKIIAAPRPLSVLNEQQLHVIGQYLYGFNSTPSGHAVSIMATVTMLVFMLRSNRVESLLYSLLMIFLGCIAAWSRVVVAAHWPADVCIGASLGILVALISLKLANCYIARYGRQSLYWVVSLELVVGAYAILEKTGYPDMFYFQWIFFCFAILSVLLRFDRIRLFINTLITLHQCQ